MQKDDILVAFRNFLIDHESVLTGDVGIDELAKAFEGYVDEADRLAVERAGAESVALFIVTLQEAEERVGRELTPEDERVIEQRLSEVADEILSYLD